MSAVVDRTKLSKDNTFAKTTVVEQKTKHIQATPRTAGLLEIHLRRNRKQSDSRKNGGKHHRSEIPLGKLECGCRQASFFLREISECRYRQVEFDRSTQFIQCFFRFHFQTPSVVVNFLFLSHLFIS